MKWWGYIIILLALMLVLYTITRRQDIKGAIGSYKIYRAVRAQKYYIKDFVFISGGEAIRFDYIVINSSGVFAISVHNLRGILTNFQGRLYLKAFLSKQKYRSQPFYKYLNPVPHDVKKVIKLNVFVPEKVDIIPVIVFPRGNDKKIRAMWLTPVNELIKVFSEPCDEPLTDEEIENLYNSLMAIKVKDKKAKKLEKMFITRHCPQCGNYIYDAQDGNAVYLKCSVCSFRCDLTASVIKENDDG